MHVALELVPLTSTTEKESTLPQVSMSESLVLLVRGKRRLAEGRRASGCLLVMPDQVPQTVSGQGRKHKYHRSASLLCLSLPSFVWLIEYVPIPLFRIVIEICC